MSPPTVDKFLGEIARIVHERNGLQLQDYLVIEPPLPQLYNQIVTELKQAYPSAASHEALEKKVRSFIPEYEDGNEDNTSNTSRSTFITFMVKYFAFLRDVNVENLLETHDMLKSLLM